MCGRFADKYQKPAITGVKTLKAMNAWEVVDCTKDMNIFQSTWVLKMKHFLDGLITAQSSIFCMRRSVN